MLVTCYMLDETYIAYVRAKQIMMSDLHLSMQANKVHCTVNNARCSDAYACASQQEPAAKLNDR